MVNKNRHVLLGMSGGTDSSVAAILLQEAGYEVTGITFRFYEHDDSTEYLEDARELAMRLGIRHLTLDTRTVFKERIITYFVEEYLQGHTPVPCTLCNNLLKWPLLAKVADEEGIFHIATGHYVRKTCIDGIYYLTPAADPDKEQSFFLWGLKQDILKRMLLPMGEITKIQARALAQEKGFTKAAHKKDSLGVCFCPKDYRDFLKSYVQNEIVTTVTPTVTPVTGNKKGKFIDEKGNFIGWHEGYPFYTIGQRRGLGIHLNRAVFVKEIRPESNEIVLSDLQALEKKEILLKDWNIVNEKLLLGQQDIIVKIRYRKQENHGMVTLRPDGTLHIQLKEPLAAVAVGQAAAFYKNGLLLGGGIIASSL